MLHLPMIGLAAAPKLPRAEPIIIAPRIRLRTTIILRCNNPAQSPRTPMYIGTPLSPTATRVMLLGSGELGKEVIIALQRLGVETIAVDRYADAPGQQVAHHARTIAMNDPQQLQALIKSERPD